MCLVVVQQRTVNEMLSQLPLIRQRRNNKSTYLYVVSIKYLLTFSKYILTKNGNWFEKAERASMNETRPLFSQFRKKADTRASVCILITYIRIGDSEVN